MNKLLGLLIAFTLAVPVTLMLLPEDASDNKTHACALIIGNTANNYHVASDDTRISSAVSSLYDAGGFLSIILAQGTPEVIEASAIDPPVNPSPESLEKRFKTSDGPFSILQTIGSAPKSDEVDYLSSISLASSTLNSEEATSCDTRTIYLIGCSGLSTKGEFLNYTKGVHESDYQSLVEQMLEEEALPKLDNIVIVWEGFGVVAPPQMDIPSKDVKRMRELFTLVLSAAGASSIEFIDSVPGNTINAEEEGYPFVTPIPFAPTEIGEWSLPEPVQFAESLLGFIPQSEVFLDGEDYARAHLHPYADALLNSGQRVIILGCTYTNGTGPEIELGLLRALKVKGILVSLGVPEEQLLVVSAGNLGTSVQVGGENYDFFKADNPEFSRSVWLVPLEQGEDILSRFTTY